MRHLQIGFAGLFCCAIAATDAVGVQAAERIAVELRETAGIRRFQFPVAVQLTLAKPVPRETTFRLMNDGKPMLAQFRADEQGDSVAKWWLDFPVNLLPYQSLVYEVEYGGDLPEGPGRTRGHKLVESDEAFQIVNDPYITWSVERNLKGLLRSVRAGDLEYLRPDSAGLFLRDCDGTDHSFGGKPAGREPARVIRQGPLAVGLRFEFVETDPEIENVRSTVDLAFPVFKSWVEVDWRIDDPQGRLAGAGAKLETNLNEPTRQAPTLVDFGASSLVYLALRSGQQTRLAGGPGVRESSRQAAGGLFHTWEVVRGKPDQLEPFVFGPRQSDGGATPEGWAHVMDRQRCLAIAVDGFARDTEDHLSVSAEGTVEVYRQFAARDANARPAAKRLRFWLHCVPFPPQQTAATSPQSMQTPIVTRVLREASPESR